MKIYFCFFIALMLNLSTYSQQTLGLFQNDSTAFNGYTLIAPTSSPMVWLIDNCGQVVNQWTTSNSSGQVTYLMPDGRLLRTIRINGAFSGGGSGGRLEVYSWEGDLVWRYNYANSNHHQHHDVELMPNGNILIMAWEGRSQAEAIGSGRAPASVTSQGLWPEQIVEVEMVGEDDINIVWEWHLWDHLVQDIDSTKLNFGVVVDHPELVDINYRNSGAAADWIHANSIDYSPELDQIILNSRNFGEFWIIDHSTTTAEAASHSGGNSGKGGDILYRWGNPITYGRGTTSDQKTFGQHDSHWIPAGLPDAGKIMIFNNGQGRPEGPYSTIEVIDPPMDNGGNYIIEDSLAYGPETVFWNYTAQPPLAFSSQRISGAQRMPNGNTLICEGNSGHIFEITETGQKVWDYIAPVSGAGPIPQSSTLAPSTIFRAYRYAPDFSAFNGRELIAGDVIELNPLPSDCIIYENIMTSATTISNSLQGIQLIKNPITDHLLVNNNTAQSIQFSIYNLNGQILQQLQSSDELTTFDLQNWPSGFYILKAQSLSHQQFSIHKFVKQ